MSDDEASGPGAEGGEPGYGEALAELDEILRELEGSHTGGGAGLGRGGAYSPRTEADPDQLPLAFGTHPLVEELEGLEESGEIMRSAAVRALSKT